MSPIDRKKLIERGAGSRILALWGPPLLLIFWIENVNEDFFTKLVIIVSLSYAWSYFLLKTKTGDHLFVFNNGYNEIIIDSIDPEKFNENFKDEAA